MGVGAARFLLISWIPVIGAQHPESEVACHETEADRLELCGIELAPGDTQRVRTLDTEFGTRVSDELGKHQRPLGCADVCIQFNSLVFKS